MPLVKQLLAQLGLQSQSLPYFLEPVVSGQSLQIYFCKLFQALGESASQLEQQSLMLKFFSQILRKYAKPRYHLCTIKPETKAIACVRDYLEAHYAENITIETLAELVGLNPLATS